MNWFGRFITSSIGKKLIMSLTGLFLIIFLVVHLSGNLQLLAGDGGQSFNEYTKFMTSNPLVKTISYGLYTFILLHAIQGMVIAYKNYKSRGPVGYRKKQASDASWAARNMTLLGILIFAFLMLHMGDFWYSYHFGDLDTVTYDSENYKDMYQKVVVSFQQPWIVISYLVGLIALAFHLYHGFDSAFKTLGINHPKWTPIIKWIGIIYSILIPIGFAIIPIVMYFNNLN